MSEHQKPLVSGHNGASASTRTYVAGFTISVALTLAAYVLVVNHLFSPGWLMLAIGGLAVSQFIVQMYYFLHLGQESKPRLKLLAVLFMLMIVFIVVFGSIWIMNNLNYSMHMSPDELKTYLHKNEGL